MALDFIAGCIGGCAGVVVGHPFDTIKVHIQTGKYIGAFRSMKLIFRSESMRGFYKGMTSPLAGVAGLNALAFGVYGNTQRLFEEPDALRTHFLAGSCAGFVQSILASPVELVKLRLQLSKDTIGPFKCIRKIYQVKGLPGIFRGLGLTILRDVPSFGLYFSSYEYFIKSENNGHVGTGRLFVAGGGAGVISWIFTYPLDVLKSRMQCDGMNGIPQHTNVLDCLRKSIAHEGAGFLWRGLMPTLLRAFPVNATTFTVVGWTMKMLESDVMFELVVAPADTFT